MFRKSLVYLGSNIANALVPLTLLPILTRTLTTAEYGQVGLFQTLVTAFAGFVGLGAASAAGRRYFDDRDDPERLAYFISAAIQVATLSLLPVIAILLLFSDAISKQLAIPAWWVIGAAVIPGLNVLIQLRLVQWQVRGAAFAYGTLQVGYSVVNLVLSLILILVLQTGGAGRIGAQIAAAILVAVIAVILLHRDALLRAFAWRRDDIRELLAYGLPLVPHTFGLFLLIYADRIIVADRLGLPLAGQYIAAMQLVTGVGIVFDAINKAYVPWLYERLKAGNPMEQRRIVRFTYAWFVAIAAGVAFAFLVGSYIFLLIAGPDYRDAAAIVGWIAMGQGLSGMYLMVTNYIFYSRRTGVLAITTMISAIVGLGALLLMIEPLGLLGAAYAYCIGMGTRFLLTWGAAQTRHPMPWLSALAPVRAVHHAAPHSPLDGLDDR